MNQEILKQKHYWNKVAAEFDLIYSHRKKGWKNLLDLIFRWDMYRRFDYTLENAEPIVERTFIDVGCGSGRYSLELARRKAQKVVGLDISENMIEICAQRAIEEQLIDRCSFVQTDLLSYYPENVFNVCIGIGLFDYIKNPLPVLIKMREVVKDKAIMSFPKLWTWRTPIRKIRLHFRKCNVYFYTRKQIDSLLKTAGFKRYDIKEIGQLYCLTAFVD